MTWLLDLQNRDGGIPTFCRGWGALPFDRSGADLTAHALAAWNAWLPDLPPQLAARTRRAMAAALRYLERVQRPDGAWVPLWFGNQAAPEEANPTYGTARVILALHELPEAGSTRERGMEWLLAAQNEDGGWGGAPGTASSMEETALAVHALAACPGPETERLSDGLTRGAAWLIERSDRGCAAEASPIGFYFARLWYFERLYPLVFAVGAVGCLRRRWAGGD